MRALLVITLLALLHPAGASAASVKLLDCTTALEAADRSATFEARMRAVPGTAQMQLKFTLQAREPAEEWRRVAGPRLDRWIASDPGVRRYTFAKRVENLPAPAAYRVVVRFRWLGADGEILLRARETSATCRQPDLRPDLVVERVELQPAADPGSRRYVVPVRNDGRTAAGPFTVTLQSGDAVREDVTVDGLAPGERRVVVFEAPHCGGAPLVVTVDAAQAVDERDEADNVLQAACPL